ncbi:MAG: amidophosphoribosyltransferase [Ignavibacteriales bacterium]|nr:amidophosphoribosyltransferase [Ignavibacteriales bacterium]
MIPDKPNSYCGIFGVFGSENASMLTYYGLHALQHRGQEASGIVSADLKENGKTTFNIHKALGLVSEIYDENILKTELPGFAAIGHNRYSTTGASESRKNIQPFMVNYRLGHLAVAHNGNLTNAHILRKQLVNDGAIFQTTSDTEVILHLIARSRLENQIDQVLEALQKIEGAYCLVILTNDKLIVARDPYGFRPLALGRLNGSYIFASETCAFDINYAEYVRDVKPGEMIVIDRNVLENHRIKSFQIHQSSFPTKHCVFEYIYFSRPDSKIFGHSVDKIRRKLGKVLAKNHPVIDKDGEKVIVISVPDSSNTAAMGYENQLEKDGIKAKFEIGLIRSHYIGRTFIQPGQQKREMGVRIKFNVVKGVLHNKTIVLVDDSIVRGTTSKQLVNLIKEANPKELHIRITSPPIINPCYYGMDFPSKEELIAHKMNSDIEKIKEHLEVDSLEYLTIDEMLQAMVDQEPHHFCTACFSGNYPTEVNSTFTKEVYEE